MTARIRTKNKGVTALRHIGGALALAAAATAAACAPRDAPVDPDFPLRVVEAPTNGPTVALVAGVHGGKVAAVRAVAALERSLAGRLRAGRVLLLAPANAAGYRAGLAQTSPDDGLNLNRVFPGDPGGSPTERLAARILRDIVAVSDYLVDLHGSDGDEAVGSFAYAARPGLDPRVDSTARWMAEAWGVPVIVWDDAGPRTLETSRFLQTAAHLSGVPAITVFAAGAAREDSVATAGFVAGAEGLLAALGMLPAADSGRPTPSAEILPRRAVHSATSDAVWVPAARPQARVIPGTLLGRLEDTVGGRHEIRSETAGVILHQRRPGAARAETPLVIIGVVESPAGAAAEAVNSRQAFAILP